MASEHTAKAFDSDLQELTRLVAEMGGLAERMIVDCVDALIRRDIALGQRVVAEDAEIDNLQRVIEETKGVVVIDEAKQQAGRGLVYDQTNVAAYPHRPEILVFGFVEAVKAQSRTGRIQLEVKSGRFNRFLLLSSQSRQAVGEGICNAEFHQSTLNTFITSSPR